MESPVAHDTNKKPRPRAIESISITPVAANTVLVRVTAGTLEGKSARIITVPPSGAYFQPSGPLGQSNTNQPEKKRA